MAAANRSSTKLSASWQLNAALLSRPVDLTALVSMSKTNPEKFVEDDVLNKLVKVLLNEANATKSDKDTKLDVLNILANAANKYSYAADQRGGRNSVFSKALQLVRTALQSVSEWFDEYISSEELSAESEESLDDEPEPELHKAMVLLLARCWDYKLKTEDVLELTQGNRRLALMVVVGLLQDGETYSTVLKQKQKPAIGQVGQWEHELVCHRYEKPLVLQICRLLRGFTHPGTYFDSSRTSGPDQMDGDIALYSVDKFSDEMDSLLAITLRSGLVEKLAVSLYDCLFNDELSAEGSEPELDMKSDEKGMVNGIRLLDESDHMAIVCVHAFLQNLYFYASKNNEEYRLHMLMDTLLIPRLILPYLDRCVTHACILNKKVEDYNNVSGVDEKGDDGVALLALHNPQLVKGLAASLRTIILASFRAPSTQYVMSLLRRLNPTTHLLRATAFCMYHEYIFALICMVNINMGVLDMGVAGALIQETRSDSKSLTGPMGVTYAFLRDLVMIFNKMDSVKQMRVIKRVQYSGALPVARDTPSYNTILSILYGGATSGQLDYILKELSITGTGVDTVNNLGVELGDEDDNRLWDSRSEAKRAHNERLHAQKVALDAAVADGKQNVKVPTVVPPLRMDAKESSGVREEKAEYVPKNQPSSLLGELPSLAKSKQSIEENVKIALSLQLPNNASKPVVGLLQQSRLADAKAESNQADDSKIPKEFLCAINGHILKEPMRVVRNGKPTELVFEKATIEIWLKTGGSVCPITHEPLDSSNLVLDEELRTRIKRYHIQQTTFASKNNDSYGKNDGEDDLYDF